MRIETIQEVPSQSPNFNRSLEWVYSMSRYNQFQLRKRSEIRINISRTLKLNLYK